MSVEDIVDGLAIIQQKRGRIVDQGDVEMLALAIKELRKGRPGTAQRAEVAPLHPHLQMAVGGHSIGVFKDGKLIAADAEVYKEPDYKELYLDLLMSVGNKWPGESRHDTAKRYILQAERGSDTPAQAKSALNPKAAWPFPEKRDGGPLSGGKNG